MSFVPTGIIAVSGLGGVSAQSGASLRCRTRPKPWIGTAPVALTCQPRPTPWAWTLPTAKAAAITQPVIISKPVVRAPTPVVRAPIVTRPPPVVTTKPPVAAKCEAGARGCACLPNGSCNWGLRCANYICVTCPVGTHHCPCDAQGKCPGRTKKTGKLYCKKGTCKKKKKYWALDPWPKIKSKFEGIGQVDAEEPEELDLPLTVLVWAGIIGVAGYIAWATLNPPARRAGR